LHTIKLGYLPNAPHFHLHCLGTVRILFVARNSKAKDPFVESYDVPKRGVCSSGCNEASLALASFSSCFALRLSLSSNLIAIVKRQPCKIPVTINIPHELHPATPYLIIRLAAKTKLPGVCISIIGMLKLMTCCKRQVVYNCGMYCTQASSAAHTPSAVAQIPSRDGNHSCTTTEAITITTECATQMRTTVRASRQDGGGGESGS